MKYVHTQINLPELSAAPDTPISDFSKLYNKNGILNYKNDLGVEQIVPCKRSIPTISKMWVREDFANTNGGVIAFDLSFNTTSPVSTNTELGVLYIPLGANTTHEGPSLMPSQNSGLNGYMFEVKFKINASYELHGNVGMGTTIAALPNEANAVTLQFVPATSSIRGYADYITTTYTSTSFPYTLGTWYIGRVIIAEDRSYITYKILNSDTSEILWTDTIASNGNNIPPEGNMTDAEFQIAWPTGAPSMSANTNAASVDYMGYGHVDGFFRTYGVMP